MRRSCAGRRRRGAIADAGWTLAQTDRRPARSRRPTRNAYDRYLAAQPRLVDVGARARRDRRHGRGRRLHPALPGRRSPGRTCAARSRARSPARSSTRAGPIRSTPPSGSSTRASRARAVPSARRRRADGRHHQPVDAGVGRREHRRAATAPSATSTRASARCCASAPTRREVLERLRWLGGEFFADDAGGRRAGCGPIDLKPLMAQALHMGDEVHNRNAAASGLLFKRLALALLDGRRRPATPSPRARVRRRQRPLLPQPLDGGVQGDVDAAARRARQQHGHGDGPQRRQLRHPAVAAPATVVPGARQSRRRPVLSRLLASTTPPPTSATRRSPRPTASAASRWRRRRRSSSSSAARRPTRLHHSLRMRAITLGRQSGVHAARAQFRAARQPASTRARWSTRGVLPIINTGIAHREAGRRADRRGHHHGADGVLQRGRDGAGSAPARRSG